MYYPVDLSHVEENLVYVLDWITSLMSKYNNCRIEPQPDVVGIEMCQVKDVRDSYQVRKIKEADKAK